MPATTGQPLVRLAAPTVIATLLLLGCASMGPPPTLEYIRASTGDFNVSSGPLDKTFQNLGPVKLDPSISAAVIPSYRDADYSIFLMFEYTSYGTLPFGGMTLDGTTFWARQVTVPHVDSCSSNGRCTFVDFYTVKITKEALDKIAAAPESYPVEVTMGNQRLAAKLPAAEARQVRAVVQAAI
jgi:hypothetical protein